MRSSCPQLLGATTVGRPTSSPADPARRSGGGSAGRARRIARPTGGPYSPSGARTDQGETHGPQQERPSEQRQGQGRDDQEQGWREGHVRLSRTPRRQTVEGLEGQPI